MRYVPPAITVNTQRIVAIGGDRGLVVYVDGQERQYRNVHTRWSDDHWTIHTATYGTRTQKKTWTVRDEWHHSSASWANMGPIPQEVIDAGMRAILDQIKAEMNLLEKMRADIEGDGPPTVLHVGLDVV